MDILRATVRWDGFPGAPGYSNFHFSVDGGLWDGGLLGDEAEAAASTAYQRLGDAFRNLAGVVPGIVNFTFLQEAVILDSDTGETLGAVARGEVTSSQPSGDDPYAGPVGGVVNWNTQDYRFGRRIRGRTFLVPLAASAYEGDGTLTPAALTSIRDFAADIVGNDGGPEFGVWSRPRAGTGGVFATVVGASVPDLAAVLRSRRD